MQILLRLKSLVPFPSDPLYFRIQGSQLLQFLVGGLAGRTFFQKVGKVLVDVYSIRLCHFYHCVDQCTRLRSGWNDRKQPVFPANNHLLYSSLTSLSLYQHKLVNGASKSSVSGKRTGRSRLQRTERKPVGFRTASRKQPARTDCVPTTISNRCWKQ